MARKNKKEEAEPVEKSATVIAGAIKDDFCNYTLDVKSGAGAGNHAVKGIGIVDESLKIAFFKLNVHLAALDDAFKETGIDEDINTLHDHEITKKYTVTGFQMKGTEEAPAIILMGTKVVVTAGGHIDIKTPKINLDRGAFYKWYNELNDAAREAVMEVEEYHNGKYTMLEHTEDDPGQLSITDEQTHDFEDARV